MKNILFIMLFTLVFYSCTSVDSLIKDKNIDKAVEFCNEEKENKDVCYEKIADDFFKKGDFLNAEKYYGSDFAKNTKKRKKSSFQIAENFLDKKLYNKALRYYDKTNRRDEGYLKIADAYFKANQLFEALKLYEILDNKKGIKDIAKRYYKNGEYLRALNLFTKLKLKNKYALDVAKKLLLVNSFVDSAKLYRFIGNLNKSRESYKEFAYNLLKSKDFIGLLNNNNSPIVSILMSDDYLFAITQKGDIYQSYIYDNKYKKVFSLNSKREKLIKAKYLHKSNQIVLLTNAGLIFYDLVNKQIKRRLNKKITAFAITKSENFLITANENIISVRDFDSFDEVLFFKKHTARVNNILISKNTVFSAGKDKLIRVWDIETGNQLYLLRGHFLEITSLALSKNNKFLASGSKDKTVKLWDLKTKKLKENYKLKFKVNSLKYSNDSSKLIVAIDDRIIKYIDLIEDKIDDGGLFHTSKVLNLALDIHDNFVYSGAKDGSLFLSVINKDLLVENLFNKAMLSKEDYLEVAQLYFKDKKYKLSASYYQLSNKKDEGISKIGDAYFGQENYDEALKYYSLLNDKKHLERSADTYFKLGDYQKASEYYFRAEDKVGVLKCAKMFLYEENYYDSIKLYVNLAKSYDTNTDKSKIDSLYLIIAKIFMEMKETTYHGSDDKAVVDDISKKLKNWYDIRYAMAEEYFIKADNAELGYLKIAEFLKENKEFDKSISFYEKLEDTKNSKKLIKECYLRAAEYNYEKTGENYKIFVNLADTEGDWKLLTESYNNTVKYLEESEKYYKLLRNYKQLRKIKKIKRKLKKYKKSLGIE